MLVTRFAPSPTSVNGGLHIGGLRTALFSYLFAKAQAGRFILRIEDTDEARSTKESYMAIADDLLWAGIKWDQGPSYNPNDYKENQVGRTGSMSFFQSDNKKIYRDFVVGNKRFITNEDGSVRICHPKEIWGADEKRCITFFDGLLGSLSCPISNIEQFILIKSSGMPSFYTACALDDYCTGVTTVIRGQEHINSTFRQLTITKALGIKNPIYIHIPLIMNQDGSKMSKRQATGQVNVVDFRKDGYTPLGLLSYVVSLGSDVGGKEALTMEQMVTNFTTDKLSRASAKFDYTKLDHINALAMRSDNDIHNRIKVFAEQYCPEIYSLINKNGVTFSRLIPAIVMRSKNMKVALNTFVEVVSPATLDETVKAKMHEKHNVILGETKSHLEVIEDETWSKEFIMERINMVAKVVGVKFGEVAQSLRIAVTGKTVSPPIDDVLFSIGKTEAISRLSNIK